MPRRSRAATIPIRAAYDVRELADAAGLTQQTFRRMLHNNGVEFMKSGRSRYVPLVEIEKKLPALWESIKTAVFLKHAAAG
jgi:excisionase family DNA binding protein